MIEYTKIVLHNGWPENINPHELYNWLYEMGIGGNWLIGDGGFKIEFENKHRDAALYFKDADLAILCRLKFGV